MPMDGSLRKDREFACQRALAAPEHHGASTARFVSRGPARMAASNLDVSRACAQAARLAAGHYEVTLREIGARRRSSRRITRARHVAIYLAHVVFGVSLTGIAAAFGRDRKSIAYACRAIEDARDDPAFDAAIAQLELAAGALRQLDRAAA